MDKLTKRAALALSRRGFLKKLPIFGGAAGLGLSGASRAFACDPCMSSGCGPCSDCTYCWIGSVRYTVCHNTCGLKCSGPAQCP